MSYNTYIHTKPNENQHLIFAKLLYDELNDIQPLVKLGEKE